MNPKTQYECYRKDFYYRRLQDLETIPPMTYTFQTLTQKTIGIVEWQQWPILTPITRINA